MYNNTGAVLRADLNLVLEEASQSTSLFIGQTLAPVFGVDYKAGQYAKITRQTGELMKAGGVERAPFGGYSRVTRAYTSDSYLTTERGLEEQIDDSQRKEVARYFAVEAVAARNILRAMQLAHEIRVADLVFNSNNWNTTTSSVALTETTAQDGTFDFPKLVLEAQNRLLKKGVPYNTLVLSQENYNIIRRSPKLQTFLYGNLPSGQYRLVTAQDLATALNIPNVLIASATQDTAGKGKAPVLTNVYSNEYMWLGQVAGGDFSAGGALRTLVWNAEGGIFVTESYRNEELRSDIVRVRHSTVEKVIDSTAAELIDLNG
jgi:hypothetical protein